MLKTQNHREKFVCVEPGYVRGFEKIAPNEAWLGQQALTVVHEERQPSL